MQTSYPTIGAGFQCSGGPANLGGAPYSSSDLGARWDIAWTLTHLGRITVALKDFDEAERVLKRAIQLSLEAQAMPQVIDATLELADCSANQGKVKEASELTLSAMQHSAITDAAKQRAAQLLSVIETQGDARRLDNLKHHQGNSETMETVLAHLV